MNTAALHNYRRRVAAASTAAALAATSLSAPAGALAASSGTAAGAGQPTAAKAATAAPTLAGLPGSLLGSAAANQPLSVVLPTGYTAGALRAAIIAAGAFQSAAAPSGLDVKAFVGSPSAQQLGAAPGPVLRIDQRPGATQMSIQQLADGSRELTLSGTGAGLLTAARLLSSPAIAALTGSSAAIPAGIAKMITTAPKHSALTLAPATANGTGKLTVTSSFTLPVDRMIDGNAPLSLEVAYDNPAGGRVVASLGAGDLGGANIAPNGSSRKLLKFKLASDPSLSGDLIPGWWAHPGANQIEVTATPKAGGESAGSSLQLLGGSSLKLKTKERPPALQLGLWPFPIYDAHAWADATVALPAHTDAATLGALIGALSGSERITGVPADPEVTLGQISKAQASRNLILVGADAVAAANARQANVSDVFPTQPTLPGVLEEVKLAHGGTALLAYGARALSAFGQGYYTGAVLGKAALVDVHGNVHELAHGQALKLFSPPRWPWLAPSAFLGLVALGWIGLRSRRARRRLEAMPKFDVAGGAS